MKIAFLLSNPRLTKYILPAIRKLSDQHEIFTYRYYNMSKFFAWPETSDDLRPAIYEELSKISYVDLGEPDQPYDVMNNAFASDFSKHVLSKYDFDLVIIDRNKAKHAWGGAAFYNILRKRKIPVVGCQEGSVGDNEKGLIAISKNLGIGYDYCFCLGDFDKEKLLNRNPYLKNRIYSVGIPGNDHLKRFVSNLNSKKHILLIPSWTKTAGESKSFKPLTDEIIEECGIYSLSAREGLPILIKEKNRLGVNGSKEFAFKHLESDNVIISMEENNLDDLIASSKYVIGAPSTLLFKPIQLGIPVAVLGEPYMGQKGVFSEFRGLTDSSEENVISVIEEQDGERHVDDGFIERAIAGGSDFTSSQKFAQAVESILNNPTCYYGKRSPNISLREWGSFKYTNQYKMLQRLKKTVKLSC